MRMSETHTGVIDHIPEITHDKEILLDGQVAIITGASRGIGRAIALKLGVHGAAVVINSTENSKEEAEKTVADLEGFGADCVWIPGDISNSNTAQSIVERTIQDFGRIDILVNNAGVRKDGIFMRMTDEQWDRVIKVNLYGAFYMTRAVIEQMARKQHSGIIVNISSDSAHLGTPGQVNYAAAKAALEGFGRSLANEYATRNIRVNNLSLGLVDTEFTANLSEAQRSAILSLTPNGKPITPEEVADTVLFLATWGSGITGQTIPVNNGLRKT